ncbi:preQ(1) synthase [Shouchella miscanthi]|uniref:NADPH-dependent 7-cyano-7-deazaguanine reductase n=1 Tax=Shouchella miscanthi TaxID=2598861 RepID=A0ABU6NFD9_9BACI|nr:preQ(1) synthase [Shouchella miscanthi]
MRNIENEENVSLLGEETKYNNAYSPKILEKFKNLHEDNEFFVKFNCPEFTSLCPKTGQPDFATVFISYIPDKYLVESKSLKLYLFSFRNKGDFHEDCINIIMKDLIAVLNPLYIEVLGKFLPRGGISIDPYSNYGRKGTEWYDMAKKRLSLHDIYPENINNR